MKLKLITKDNNTSIYLNKYYLQELNVDNRDFLERYFRKLFKSLSKNFGLSVSGYYNIKIHMDKYYGVIIELIKDEVDYFDYFINQVDMRIVIEKNSCFLYKINDFFFIDEDLKNKLVIYLFKNNLYLQVKDQIDDIEFAKILENGTIIFDKNVDKIITKGKVLTI